MSVQQGPPKPGAAVPLLTPLPLSEVWEDYSSRGTWENNVRFLQRVLRQSAAQHAAASPGSGTPCTAVLQDDTHVLAVWATQLAWHVPEAQGQAEGRGPRYIPASAGHSLDALLGAAAWMLAHRGDCAWGQSAMPVSQAAQLVSALRAAHLAARPAASTLCVCGSAGSGLQGTLAQERTWCLARGDTAGRMLGPVDGACFTPGAIADIMAERWGLGGHTRPRMTVQLRWTIPPGTELAQDAIIGHLRQARWYSWVQEVMPQLGQPLEQAWGLLGVHPVESASLECSWAEHDPSSTLWGPASPVCAGAGSAYAAHAGAADRAVLRVSWHADTAVTRAVRWARPTSTEAVRQLMICLGPVQLPAHDLAPAWPPSDSARAAKSFPSGAASARSWQQCAAALKCAQLLSCTTEARRKGWAHKPAQHLGAQFRVQAAERAATFRDVDTPSTGAGFSREHLALMGNALGSFKDSIMEAARGDDSIPSERDLNAIIEALWRSTGVPASSSVTAAGPHAAPSGGLLGRLALAMSVLPGPRSMCALWSAFLRKVRTFWERAVPLPHMPLASSAAVHSRVTRPGEHASPAVDRGACLFQQLLQCLHVCALRCNAEHAGGAPDPSSDDAPGPASFVSACSMDDELNIDAELDAAMGEGHAVKLEHAGACDGWGDAELDAAFTEPAAAAASSAASNLPLCSKPGTMIVIPAVQVLPEYFATDVSALQQHMVVARMAAASDGVSQSLKHSMQSHSLRADMSAFKAANPAAQLEDFVRWHSPRDWRPSWESHPDYCAETDCLELPGGAVSLDDARAGKVSAAQGARCPEGTLSDRMARAAGPHAWYASWRDASPVPAALQPPLFDAKAAGEAALAELEAATTSDMLLQLTAVLCAAHRDWLGQVATELSVQDMPFIEAGMSALSSSAAGLADLVHEHVLERFSLDMSHAGADAVEAHDAHVDQMVRRLTQACAQCIDTIADVETVLHRILSCQALLSPSTAAGGAGTPAQMLHIVQQVCDPRFEVAAALAKPEHYHRRAARALPVYAAIAAHAGQAEDSHTLTDLPQQHVPMCNLACAAGPSVASLVLPVLAAAAAAAADSTPVTSGSSPGADASTAPCTAPTSQAISWRQSSVAAVPALPSADPGSVWCHYTATDPQVTEQGLVYQHARLFVRGVHDPCL